jgi:ribonuclease-3 family protein
LSIGHVSAKAQRQLLLKWQPLLTEEEADVVRRGRNAKSGAPPKNADPQDYRQATGLECLVGYLYYQQQFERLGELMAVAFDEHNNKQEEDGK